MNDETQFNPPSGSGELTTQDGETFGCMTIVGPQLALAVLRGCWEEQATLFRAAGQMPASAEAVRFSSLTILPSAGAYPEAWMPAMVMLRSVLRRTSSGEWQFGESWLSSQHTRPTEKQ